MVPIGTCLCYRLLAVKVHRGGYALNSHADERPTSVTDRHGLFQPYKLPSHPQIGTVFLRTTLLDY